jgi:chemotaxis protein methyltransferase CheR
VTFSAFWSIERFIMSILSPAPTRSILAGRQPFVENKDAGTLAQAIVDTVREPLLVLDKDLRVLAASRSFYQTFKVAHGSTQGQLFYALGDGQWDIPGLRLLLERIVPEHGVMEDYEVEHEFPEIGTRTMLLNARKVFYEGNSHTTLLLGIEDVTARRTLEREREDILRKLHELLREKDVLLEELEHRVGNSLQIIAAIILMKSRMVTSEETRLQLQDAHNRVLSVAAVQKTPACYRARRPRRNGALPDATVRQPQNIDDRRLPPDNVKSDQRCRYRDLA